MKTALCHQKKLEGFFSVLLSVVLFPKLSSVPRITFYFIWFFKVFWKSFSPISAHMEGGEMNVAY